MNAIRMIFAITTTEDIVLTMNTPVPSEYLISACDGFSTYWIKTFQTQIIGAWRCLQNNSLKP